MISNICPLCGTNVLNVWRHLSQLHQVKERAEKTHLIRSFKIKRCNETANLTARVTRLEAITKQLAVTPENAKLQPIGETPLPVYLPGNAYPATTENYFLPYPRLAGQAAKRSSTPSLNKPPVRAEVTSHSESPASPSNDFSNEEPVQTPESDSSQETNSDLSSEDDEAVNRKLLKVNGRKNERPFKWESY
jgi:hypothetical protein